MYRAPLGQGQRRYRKTRLHVAMPHQLADLVIAFAERSGKPLSEAASILITLGLESLDHRTVPHEQYTDGNAIPTLQTCEKGLDRPHAHANQGHRPRRAREYVDGLPHCVLGRDGGAK